MAELKTKATTASVSDFLAEIDDAERRKDCVAVSKMMQKATGSKPRMWGPSIVGFGDRRLKYDSGASTSSDSPTSTSMYSERSSKTP